jgi:hypothetical protein
MTSRNDLTHEVLIPGQFLRHKLLGKMLYIRTNGNTLEVRRMDGTLMIAYPCEFELYQPDLHELAKQTMRLAEIVKKEAESLDSKE